MRVMVIVKVPVGELVIVHVSVWVEVAVKAGVGVLVRLAPPTHAVPPGGGSWTCGTRRHGATGQRYAVAKVRVKPSRTLTVRACG